MVVAIVRDSDRRRTMTAEAEIFDNLHGWFEKCHAIQVLTRILLELEASAVLSCQR